MDAVALQHIKKSYTSYSSEIVLTGQTRQSRTRQVLRDLSVCFPIGQLTVIVGRSGCGKSTLLKLLAGKEQPDAGEIAMPEGWHSAMLSPEPYVISWTNVQRNVAMACGVGKTPEERYEKAADFVRLVGLQDFADLTPAELSTGMKQRPSRKSSRAPSSLSRTSSKRRCCSARRSSSCTRTAPSANLIFPPSPTRATWSSPRCAH